MATQGGEEFSLKWNDHSKVFFAGAEDLAEKQEFTDVTLAAGGKLITAHKMVLSICSPFFQRLFKQLGTVGPEKTVVYLKDVQPRHLDLLIQYMYRGEIKVEEKELVTILNTAQSLEIRGLTDTVQTGPKQGKSLGPLGISPMKELRPTKRGPSSQNNNQLDANGERKRTKMDVVNEAQNLLDKEMAANNQNPPVTAESGMMEVKQEFGAITIERGAKTPTTGASGTGGGSGSTYETQSVQFPDNKDNSAVTNMGYDGYDENETEYIPEAGIVLQDDDRVEEITMLGVQMWRCKVCNKLGTYKSNMLRHTMTHTGERPHPCKFCQQSFSISSNRHRHEKKCKLNPNPSLEALVPNLLNQFNGHPTGGPGRPPHHRGFPGGAQMAMLGPGGFPGFPGGFPALPPPEGLGKPSKFQLERQKRESENLTLQKQKAAQNNSDGNGEQTKAVDMETRESRSEEKTEPRSEERKNENRESSSSSSHSSSSSSNYPGPATPGGARPAHAHQADPRPQHFPMPNHMFQQAFPWGFPYGPPGGGHHQFTPPNYGSPSHHHQKHGGRTSGSITEIADTASASMPGTPTDGFDATQGALQQQQQLPPPSHSHPHPPTPEEVQCTPSLPF